MEGLEQLKPVCDGKRLDLLTYSAHGRILRFLPAASKAQSVRTTLAVSGRSAVLDGPLPGDVLSLGAAPPELTLTNDLAVIAPAALVIAVVPVMLGPDCLAVLTLPRKTEIDQKPRQATTKAGAPFVRMPSHRVNLAPVRLLQFGHRIGRSDIRGRAGRRRRAGRP